MNGRAGRFPELALTDKSFISIDLRCLLQDHCNILGDFSARLIDEINIPTHSRRAPKGSYSFIELLTSACAHRGQKGGRPLFCPQLFSALESYTCDFRGQRTNMRTSRVLGLSLSSDY